MQKNLLSAKGADVKHKRKMKTLFVMLVALIGFVPGDTATSSCRIQNSPNAYINGEATIMRTGNGRCATIRARVFVYGTQNSGSVQCDIVYYDPQQQNTIPASQLIPFSQGAFSNGGEVYFGVCASSINSLRIHDAACQ